MVDELPYRPILGPPDATASLDRPRLASSLAGEDPRAADVCTLELNVLGGDGALSSIETTVRLAVEETMDALGLPSRFSTARPASS
jgi:hypothetical protein